MLKALITDASFRQALTVIRSLGKRHIFTAAVAGTRERNIDILGFHSKYCGAKLLMPSYRENDEAFSENIFKIAKDFDVLIPISTQAILAVAKRLERFRQVTNVAIPDYETVCRANCKDKLIRIAGEMGICVPQTIYIEDLSELGGVAEGLSYPAVVKYRSDQDLYFSPVDRYAIVNSKEQFLKVYRKMHQIQAFPLVQEYIQGTGYGFFALLDRNAQAKAIFCHRRVREYPVTGGVSSCCVSIRDEILIEQGLRLLKALNWYGVAMVEFKKDLRDGKFKLMEINPRFWGSLPLSIESGVDFPYLLFKVARGEDFEPVMKYKLGVKLRFLCLDFFSAKDSLLNNKLSSLGSFLKDILDPRIKDGIFSLDDPKVGLIYLAKYLPMYLGRIRTKNVDL